MTTRTTRTATRSSSPLRAGPIRGDELEHDRIQLEHNLQHNTDLSLHLSSQPADSEHNYESSVEYPRHNSGPEPFAVNAFASFDGDNFVGDMDSHSHLHAWSYRTADDDDEGVNPYGAESMSTAAHHASALTLSAGLRGHPGGGGRREVSLSGAEYDPDRPLGDMIAGVDSRFSMLDVDPSKSRYQATSAIAFDPLVVNDTVELDRVLQSGHAVAASSLAARLRPSIESVASDSDSDSSTRSNRPKLTDALHRVAAFSPKRPRSAQSMRAHSNQNQSPTREAGPSTYLYQRSNSSPPQAIFDNKENESEVSAPKPPSKRAPVQRPEVMVQPPTPSTVGSKFTIMAKGLARDIEAEQRSMWGAAIRNGEAEEHAMAQSTVRERKGRSRNSGRQERNPFSDVGNTLSSGARDKIGTPRAPKVHLPDVTGITSAVASPAKNGLDYYEYEGGKEPGEAEARFLSVLAAVQSKLAHLESENGISRRRVRELERELDACKVEVARERTKVMERESLVVRQHENTPSQAQKVGKQEKGKGKSIRFDNIGEAEERYREVVEEKKALEALIVTLRSHLTRLTSELSSHHQLLSELRSLRESDARTLREKSAEVERLREEVERLAGEVEVLRGVVEEGLNERRAVREASTQDEEEDEHQQTKQVQDGGKDEEETPFVPRTNVDRTMRTDRATLGSSTNAGAPSRRFVDGEELERISLELEERRSDHSGESLSRLRGDASSRSTAVRGPPGPANFAQSASRPAAPTPTHPPRPTSYGRSKPAPSMVQDPLATPFPQIRGGHLERLFFSAPEHNAKTCAVCRRRRRPDSPSWIPRHKARDLRPRVDDADEGFVEGPDAQPNVKKKRREHVTFSQDATQWRQYGEREGLPPQTVLARVLRELEDDFTHYKSIYVELAEQYGLMDAASNVSKRNVLAEHLQDVIDILEQKGDQIASLYDLLTFKDKPTSESVVPENRRTRSAPPAETSSWGRSQGLKRRPTFA